MDSDSYCRKGNTVVQLFELPILHSELDSACYCINIFLKYCHFPFQLDFTLIGILAEISLVLAEAEISMFAISTFDTDYILVNEENIDDAVAALKNKGYAFLHAMRG